ncbi:alpha/beta hydrolase [Saccharibacillus sp. CPCC 101409]|uniref:alpha/beta hydrolase family protein n=1 Tax=Saccharibacillus sp. CPCC 101409 TaxID=3058041 RepID=UPI002673D5EA|nr:alpha/beta hydrolase [Saccharibacillus sp. CPCC 101409]MDO3409285.1 alpha/beta hydrolase [Saccharibacillus sp. CPCC 101409]
MGMTILALLVGVDLVFLIRTIRTQVGHRLVKSRVRAAEILLLILLVVFGVLEWSFLYYGIFALLLLQTILGLTMARRSARISRTSKKAVGSFLGSVILHLFALLPVLIFPPYTPPVVTGSHAVAAAEYVWTDPDRIETFSEDGTNRFVTASFWYPEDEGTYPLVVFSHGAFGVPISNLSTFTELASNGYVVVSIGHPYHSFYVPGPDGRPVMADTDFIRSVYAANEMEDGPEQQALVDQWLDVRLADIHYVMDTLSRRARIASEDPVFRRIDPEKIGLFGHSLGGAASAEIGRQRPDIDAVAVLDATMLGERVGFDGENFILNESPYPVPLFNLYRQDHYEETRLYGEKYENTHASKHALSSYRAVVRKAGHMSFTDLPLASPVLGRLLDSGTVDTYYGIETTNALVLEFFNYTLKDGPAPPSERTY